MSSQKFYQQKAFFGGGVAVFIASVAAVGGASFLPTWIGTGITLFILFAIYNKVVEKSTSKSIGDIWSEISDYVYPGLVYAGIISLAALFMSQGDQSQQEIELPVAEEEQAD